MALKTFVKVSGINNLSDARYCAGMEVDLLGFCLKEGEHNYTSPEKFSEIAEWLSGVAYVGECISTSEAAKMTEGYALGYIEINASELKETIFSVNIPVIVSVELQEIPTYKALLDTFADRIAYIVLLDPSDSIGPSAIERIKELTASFSVLLGFGVSGQNVEELLKKTGIHGIALQGGDEIRPGLKDFDALADILEVLEIDDQE